MYDKNLSVEEILKCELDTYDLTLDDLTDEQIAQFKDEIRFCQNGGMILDGMECELFDISYKKGIKNICESRNWDYFYCCGCARESKKCHKLARFNRLSIGDGKLAL